jgi:group I intron endonuclease
MDYDTKTWRSSGIYAIVNKVTDRKYIGQTSRFLYRWTKHKLLLRRGEHPNPRLQGDWDLYGPGAFEFQILELVGIMGLLEREREYIKSMSNLYNR